MPLDKCFKIIEEGSGSDFDPDIVIMYCILNQKWKIMDVNIELEKNGLPEFDCIY